MYKITKFSNNLRIVTHKIKDRDSISVGLWIGVGGRYEEDKIKGSAHFLEHIVFKGSRKYTCDQIKENIEGVGGSLNAFTSEEQTCYYAKIPSKHLEKTFDTLADMVFHPIIASKDILKEKTVIIEEIKMYRDLPQYFVLDMLDGLMWPNHPLGKSLAGSIETVSSLHAKDLKNFHQKYYLPGNIVISACGAIDHNRFVRLVRDHLGHIKGEGAWNYLPLTEKQTQARVKFHKKEIEQMHLAIGLPGLDENHKDRYSLNLLSVILGGNMSSRLFVEVREKKGLAYSIASASKSLHDGGVFLIRAGVDNTKIVQALAVIFKELKKIKKTGITVSEFKRAKDYLLGQLLLGLEDTMEHMLWIGESFISKNSVKTLTAIIHDVEKIEIGDIKRVANVILDDNKMNLALIGPLTDEQQKQIANLIGLKN